MSPDQPTAHPGSRPVRSPAAREYRLGDELLLYTPDLDSAHALNLSARAIWELCDGQRTVEAICRRLAEEAGREPADLRSDVVHAVEGLATLGLVELR